MKSRFNLLRLISLLVGCGCQANHDPVATVPQVDLDRYVGQWYEIARYPNRFQRNCTCSTAFYSLNSDGSVKVVNSCRKGMAGGEPRSIEGKAFVVEGSGNAQLKVQFFWPFRAPYWIVALGDDYQWAVISGPSQRYLWILSRKPVMDDTSLQNILNWLKNNGYSPEKLIFNPANCYEKN